MSIFLHCHRIDLAVLLGKTPPSSSSETENPPMEAAQPPSLSQSLVFSNSKQGVSHSQTSSSIPHTQHSMVRPARKIQRKHFIGLISPTIPHSQIGKGYLVHQVNCFYYYCDNCVNSPTLQVSMLSKGFGDVGDAKVASTGTTGSQFLEQYKTAQALAQLAAQHSQTGPPNSTPSSWDTSATSMGPYGEMTFYCNYSDRLEMPLSIVMDNYTDL